MTNTMNTTPCTDCAGTGEVIQGDYVTGCPSCFGVGYQFAAITTETALPCPFPSDRECRRCQSRTVTVTWKGGQAIARCCRCHAYVCSLPKRSIAWALLAERQSA